VDGSSLVITRSDHQHRDRDRDYLVLVDDIEVGSIAAGDARTFTVSPGVHTLKLRIDMTGSPAISCKVEAGQVLRFVCEPNFGRFGSLWDLARASFGNKKSWIRLTQVMGD